jgi:hypothetical protein
VGYWARHEGKTTSPPFPLDDLMHVGYFGRKTHESIQGLKVRAGCLAAGAGG